MSGPLGQGSRKHATRCSSVSRAQSIARPAPTIRVLAAAPTPAPAQADPKPAPAPVWGEWESSEAARERAEGLRKAKRPREHEIGRAVREGLQTGACTNKCQSHIRSTQTHAATVPP